MIPAVFREAGLFHPGRAGQRGHVCGI